MLILEMDIKGIFDFMGFFSEKKANAARRL